MNQEENSSFDFEKYNGKVVSEKQANNQLKRKNSGIKAHMAAIIASSIVALTACAYKEVANQPEQETTVEGITETGGIPFSAEKISELQGNVVITNPEALENAYRNSDKTLINKVENGMHNVSRFRSGDAVQDREDAKNELISRGISPEQAEQMIIEAEQKADQEEQEKYKESESISNNNISPEEEELIKRVMEDEVSDTKKDLAFITGGNQKNNESKDLTQTQIIVKQAIDNALRINEIIGKNGLSESELEQVIKNSEEERAKSKEQPEKTVETSLDDTDPEYWKVGDTTYKGITPPEDTATSAWIPTGEQTPYQELENGIYKSDPTWRQISFEFDKVIHHMSYGNACSINKESNSVDLIPVYVTVDSAIRKSNPLKEKKQYQEFLDAKIGKANALIAGIYVPIEKVDGVSSFDSIGFELEKTNTEGKTEVIGYINGNDLINSLSRNIIDIVQEENSSLQR